MNLEMIFGMMDKKAKRIRLSNIPGGGGGG